MLFCIDIKIIGQIQVQNSIESVSRLWNQSYERKEYYLFSTGFSPVNIDYSFSPSQSLFYCFTFSLQLFSFIPLFFLPTSFLPTSFLLSFSLPLTFFCHSLHVTIPRKQSEENWTFLFSYLAFFLQVERKTKKIERYGKRGKKRQEVKEEENRRKNSYILMNGFLELENLYWINIWMRSFLLQFFSFSTYLPLSFSFFILLLSEAGEKSEEWKKNANIWVNE